MKRALLLGALLIALIFIYEEYAMGQTPSEILDSLTSGTGPYGGSMANSTTIAAMANAVIQEEGSSTPGTRGYNNNNPGNLKPPDGTATYWPGQVGVDSGGFAIFDNWSDGLAALQSNLSTHVSANPDQTISEYFAQYSPDSTGLSGAYGAAIAAALGVSPDTTLGAL